jgi:cyclophilin family peptidyl-prolyl cis-trans isomerase
MKFYAFKPRPDGSEPMGTEGKLLFELKTIGGAIKHSIRILGVKCRVFRYSNFYDNSTFHRIYPPFTKQ